MSADTNRTYDFPDDYPEYATQGTFSMPVSGGEAAIIATRSNRGLRGWLYMFLGQDPESDWYIYRPGYCLSFPWDHNPETQDNIPDVSNDVRDRGWREPTDAVRDYLERHYMLVIEDERVSRAMQRLRGEL